MADVISKLKTAALIAGAALIVVACGEKAAPPADVNVTTTTEATPAADATVPAADAAATDAMAAPAAGAADAMAPAADATAPAADAMATTTTTTTEEKK